MVKNLSGRPPSQSPSWDPSQPNPRIPSNIAASSEGEAMLTTNPGMAMSSIDNVASISYETNLSSTGSSEQAGYSRNTAWNELRKSLQLLMGSSSPFPRLILAIRSLLSCLAGLELALQNRQNFEDLAIELTMLSDSLKQNIGESCSSLISSATTRIAMCIEQQAIKVKTKLGHVPGESARIPDMDTGELVGHYRQIQLHFRQLQTNASMSTWITANEHLANKRLENMYPAKQALYDSGLSSEINRRGCTEGTRIDVLNGLEDWLYESTSSIYWMNGMAGTGKTTIASSFCERVEQRKLLAASFFCTRNSSECRDVARIVPTIAYQLARYSIPFQSELCKMLGQNLDIGSKSILKQFELLLKEPLQHVKDAMPDNLVVVIDALDECDDRNEIELMLDILFRHATHLPLKFMVMSRPEQEIYEKISTYGQFRDVLRLHDIEESLVRADIELYLKEELRFIPPSQAEVEELAKRSGTLFIYAATLVKYISGKRSTDPGKRLQAVLDLTAESTKKYTQIDSLYTTVLESALSDGGLETFEAEVIRTVLRTVLLAQEPIDIKSIAELAEITDPQYVTRALQALRSVLHQSQNGLVSTLHASFPDFMFNSERSRGFFCDIVEHSRPLAGRCFLIMERQLRFNICHLASSFVPDEKVERIQERIKENIPPTLAYACRYWANHLALARKSDFLLKMLHDFLSLRLLFWMEVLSLQKELFMGVDGLLKAQKWLMRASGTSLSELLLLIDDTRSFVTGFAINPSSQSTPHIYLSTLAFCPKSNSVYKHYRKRAQGLLELKGSLMECREAAPLATWSVGSEILSLALSPDGTRVAIGCLDSTVSILSAYDGLVQVGPLQGHPNSINSIAFSPDGGRIVSASLGSIRVWDAYNGTRVSGVFKGHMRYINSVSFSPDGARVVSSGHDTTIRIWNAYNGLPLLDPLTEHTNPVFCVTFSPDGDLIASASGDQTVRLWHSQNGAPAAPPFHGHTGMVNSLAFTPDGTRLVSGSSDKTIRVWDVSDGSLVNNFFEGYVGTVDTLAISPDSTRIAAGCYDKAVRVWNIDDGKLVAGPFFGHGDSVKSVAYSRDGTRVFSGSTDKTIRVWNVRNGILPPAPPSQGTITDIRTVIFCPDNTHFLSSGGLNNVLRLWDVNDGSVVTMPDEANFFPTPLSLLSWDGSYIASTSKNGMVQVTSTQNGSLVAGPFEVERSSLSAFWFSHNNKAILMGCHDGTIKICNLQGGKVKIGSFIGHHKGVSSLAESLDCSLLVSHSNFEFAVRVWNITAPALELGFFKDTPIESSSDHSYAAVYDGWKIRKDGWVMNNNCDLLFWLPPDIASAWCCPYATLAVTKSGTLQVPRQKPLIGYHWADCYIAD